MCVLSTWFGDICGSRRDFCMFYRLVTSLFLNSIGLYCYCAITELVMIRTSTSRTATRANRNSDVRNGNSRIGECRLGSHNVTNGTALYKINYTGMFPVGDTSSGTLIAVCVCVCVSVSQCVCLSADISLYCAKNDSTDYPEIVWVCWVWRCHECIKFWLRTN